jgi:hypothetical protein
VGYGIPVAHSVFAGLRRRRFQRYRRLVAADQKAAGAGEAKHGEALHIVLLTLIVNYYYLYRICGEINLKKHIIVLLET